MAFRFSLRAHRSAAASFASRKPAKTSRRPRSSATLALEPLEPRCLLSASGFSPIDGVGNNQTNTLLGSVNTDLKRMVPAAYTDGISAPVSNRPSARVISNILSNQSGDVLDNRNLSAFIYAWGQFIDHDMDLTTTTADNSLPISVPKGDTTFDPFNLGGKTLPFNRSVTDPNTGPVTNTVLQQLNQITSFLDGSMIYGSDPARAAALRDVGGKLKVSAGNLLPFNTPLLPNANDAHLLPDGQMFLAGDVRANENVDETALQTLFVREHNRLATQIAAANPKLSSDDIYSQARQMVIAEIQAITYNEFLPALLGPKALPAYTGYKSNVDPSISTEFSTAAFRVGHSEVGDDIEFMDNTGNAVRDELPMSQSFFDPRIIETYGIDPVLKYLASDVAQAVDTRAVDGLRNMLFGPPGSTGQDLIALDIQRGRDHGLADYNTTRVAFGLAPVASFAQISSDPAVQAGLIQAYGQTNGVDNVNNIDLFVGLVAEDHLKGSSVGALTQKIIADQFTRLRDGDRFFYKNVFSGKQLWQLDGTTLADVIRRNTTITNLQDNVFVFNTAITGQVWLTSSMIGGKPCKGPGGGVSPAAGVSVNLYDADGNLVATTTTDSHGSYKFTGTGLGSYTVNATVINGTTSTDYNRNVAVTRGGMMFGIDLGLKLDVGGHLPGNPGGNLGCGWDNGWFGW